MTGELFAEGTGAAGSPRARDDAAARTAPLAERMRPRTFDALVGQEALLAPGAPLSLMREGTLLSSLILWGPPGSGKTTIARLVADTAGVTFVAFSAVLSAVREGRERVA